VILFTGDTKNLSEQLVVVCVLDYSGAVDSSNEKQMYFIDLL